MSLLDTIEMVVDWKAAAEMYGQTSFRESLEISRKRFCLSDRQFWLVEMIADAIDE